MSNPKNIKEYICDYISKQDKIQKSKRLKTPFRLYIRCYPDYDFEWCSPEIYYDTKKNQFYLKQQKINPEQEHGDTTLLTFKDLNVVLEYLWMEFDSKLRFKKLEDDEVEGEITFFNLTIYYGHLNAYPMYQNITGHCGLTTVKAYPTFYTLEKMNMLEIFENAINHMKFLLINDALNI